MGVQNSTTEMNEQKKGREELWVGEMRGSKGDPPWTLVFRDFDQQGQFRRVVCPGFP